MDNKAKRILALFINIIEIALAITGLCMAYSYTGDGRHPALNWIFFTNDSNLLLATSGAILLAYQLLNIIRKKEIPSWIRGFYQVASTGTTLTFLTVALVLTPMVQNMTLFYEGNFIYLHTLCPLLGLTQAIFFLDLRFLNWKKAFLGIVPMGVYFLVAEPLVIAGVASAPYPFMDVNGNPWWISVLFFLLMFGLGYGISIGTIALSKLVHKEKATS